MCANEGNRIDKRSKYLTVPHQQWVLKHKTETKSKYKGNSRVKLCLHDIILVVFVTSVHISKFKIFVLVLKKEKNYENKQGKASLLLLYLRSHPSVCPSLSCHHLSNCFFSCKTKVN